MSFTPSTPSKLVRRSRVCWAGLVLVLFSTTIAAALDGGERVDALAADLLEISGLPSLSVAILEGDEIVHASALGLADVETERAADPDTRYRAASVSKILTATALGRLVAAGSIDLDRPIADYGVEFPDAETITARQLAGHLSGIAHYQPQDRIDRSRHYESVTASLDIFRESPRAGAPGEQYAYTTHGYTLLSAAIEGAAGKPFLDVLEEQVFAPLGMTSSGPDQRSGPPPEMSQLYQMIGLEPRVAIMPFAEDPSYKWAGGGLVTTPSDLVRLARGYLSDDFLPPEVREEMWTSQTTEDGEETGVGIGWRIAETEAGHRIIHHAGSMAGARSVIVIEPETERAIAVMTNANWSSAIEPVALTLLKAFDAETQAASRTGSFEHRGQLLDAELHGEVHLGPLEGEITLLGEWPQRLRRSAVEEIPLRRIGDNWTAIHPWGMGPFALVDGESLSARLEISGRMVLETKLKPLSSPGNMAPNEAAHALLERSLDFHDPDRRWSSAQLELRIREDRPDGGARESTVTIDNAHGHFELVRVDGDERWRLEVEGDRVLHVEPRPDETREEAEQRARWMRNYYLYLWGLPMKLVDDGANLAPEVVADPFRGRDALRIEVGYDPEVGEETWWFWFDPGTAELIGCRFSRGGDRPNDETIVIEGRESVAGLVLPKSRTWYVTDGWELLGTDSLQPRR